jgi:hypothetical protein
MANAARLAIRRRPLAVARRCFKLPRFMTRKTRAIPLHHEERFRDT